MTQTVFGVRFVLLNSKELHLRRAHSRTGLDRGGRRVSVHGPGEAIIRRRVWQARRQIGQTNIAEFLDDFVRALGEPAANGLRKAIWQGLTGVLALQYAIAYAKEEEQYSPSTEADVVGRTGAHKDELLSLLKELRENHPDTCFSVGQKLSGQETKELWAEVDAVLAREGVSNE